MPMLRLYSDAALPDNAQYFELNWRGQPNLFVCIIAQPQLATFTPVMAGSRGRPTTALDQFMRPFYTVTDDLYPNQTLLAAQDMTNRIIGEPVLSHNPPRRAIADG